jgi:hypothetical protein
VIYANHTDVSRCIVVLGDSEVSAPVLVQMLDALPQSDGFDKQVFDGADAGSLRHDFIDGPLSY